MYNALIFGVGAFIVAANASPQAIHNSLPVVANSPIVAFHTTETPAALVETATTKTGFAADQFSILPYPFRPEWFSHKFVTMPSQPTEAPVAIETAAAETPGALLEASPTEKTLAAGHIPKRLSPFRPERPSHKLATMLPVPTKAQPGNGTAAGHIPKRFFPFRPERPSHKLATMLPVPTKVQPGNGTSADATPTVLLETASTKETLAAGHIPKRLFPFRPERPSHKLATMLPVPTKAQPGNGTAAGRIPKRLFPFRPERPSHKLASMLPVPTKAPAGNGTAADATPAALFERSTSTTNSDPRPFPKGLFPFPFPFPFTFGRRPKHPSHNVTMLSTPTGTPVADQSTPPAFRIVATAGPTDIVLNTSAYDGSALVTATPSLEARQLVIPDLHAEQKTRSKN